MRSKANQSPRTNKELLAESAQLRDRLAEAEQTLAAIRSGDVDALIVEGPEGARVFSLTGAERTYRLIVETMNEAALTVNLVGTILFCNQRFCDLVKTSILHTVGQKLTAFFAPAQHPGLRILLADAQASAVQRLLTLRATDGTPVPVQIAANLLVVDNLPSICLVATDLTALEAQTQSLHVMHGQQRTLQETQAELQAANALMNDARRAALNIMEDAVLANRETRKVSAALQGEIKIRMRAEEALQHAHDDLEKKVNTRTAELTEANKNLLREIAERKRAEESLQLAFEEISRLKVQLHAENVYLQKEIAQRYNFDEIIGQSDAISQVFQRVEQVAPMQATVLLLGETGTGKGVVARAIHSCSARKDRPMITVNCTALPANLIESELFGRERGAFTGADARQIGRFELADHGTIFLDEIGEMPLELQPKLLRVVQDGEFERLGSPRTIKVDVRIIAASNRNLEQEIMQGRFREDLFYRLNVFPIVLPPLRQREEDIELLIKHFVAKFNKKTGKRIESIAPETLKAMREYHWPGNVRELESVIERAVITSQGTVLQVLDRFDTFSKGELTSDEVKGLVELEHDHILKVLLKTNWRVEGKKGAAILLGINPSTLRARMRKYGIARHQMNDTPDQPRFSST